MTGAPKVCMLVAYHPFLDARIFKKEAVGLARNGFGVTLAAPRKNGRLFDIDGTPFADRFLEAAFVHKGVRVVTYEGAFERPDPSHMLRASAPDRPLPPTDPLSRLAVEQEADIYHAHEFISLYSGVCAKRAMAARGKRVALIYDSHEIVPDPHGAGSRERKDALLQALRAMLRETDAVIAVSDAMKAWYESIDPSLRVEVIYNSPPLAKPFREKAFDSGALTAGYEGNLTRKKGNAAKIVGITRACKAATKFRFKIIGGTRSGEPEWVPADLRNDIVRIGWVEYDSIPSRMQDVDIGWIDYEFPNLLNHAVALPNKFFSFLNNGVPVVVNRCQEMKRFIETYRCGLVIDKPYPSIKDYKRALLELHADSPRLREMSRNARRAMEDEYSWEHMENRLLKLYGSLR